MLEGEILIHTFWFCTVLLEETALLHANVFCIIIINFNLGKNMSGFQNLSKS